MGRVGKGSLPHAPYDLPKPGLRVAALGPVERRKPPRNKLRIQARVLEKDRVDILQVPGTSRHHLVDNKVLRGGEVHAGPPDPDRSGAGYRSPFVVEGGQDEIDPDAGGGIGTRENHRRARTGKRGGGGGAGAG